MWFIRFAIFCVHEYCVHAYILTRIVQPGFLFCSQLKIHCFKFSSTSLAQWKLKQNVLGSLIKIIFSSKIIITWLNCCKLFLVILLCWYERYNICLISFFNLHQLFPQLSFVLIILEFQLIVCWELIFLILFVVACQINL